MDKTKMLEELINHYTNGNKARFAKILGVSAQTVSAWIARNTFDAELIYTKCRYLNSSWLLTGKGDMLKQQEAPATPTTPTKPTASTDERPTKPARHVEEGSREGIPLIPLSAMAGAFTGSDDGVMEYECERYVIPAFKGADFLIQIKGDSMQPTYYSGDLVACQRMPLNDIFFQWNKAYVLDTVQGPLVKRIMPGTDADHVLIVSDNKDYPPFELSKDQFHGVALVRGLVRLE